MVVLISGDERLRKTSAATKVPSIIPAMEEWDQMPIVATTESSKAGSWRINFSAAWILAAGLLVACAVIGMMVGALARPIFILGCVAVSYFGWRQGPEAHIKALLALFCFAPFVRRLVDLTAGYDTSGLMLVGPLAAAGLPVLLVFDDLTPERLRHPQTGAILAVAASVFYALVLTIFQGEWMNAISNALKWMSPLSYALSIIASRTNPDRLIRAATSAFIVILPLMGLYGIYQYVDPPEWDRFWMKSATILSAGQPEPFGVRTFSVLNSPASFGTYTTVGLLLVLFLRPALWTVVLILPAAVSLMLSMYRTGWIALAIGIGFCLFFKATRGRAAASLAAIGLMIVGMILSPFGDAILDRISTLGQGADDGSARERLAEFLTLWMRPDSGLIGSGFTSVDVGSAGAMAIDGIFISCWVAMGLVVGLFCIGGLFYAIGNAIVLGAASGRGTDVAIGAFAIGALAQLPLSSIVSAETGFIFWAFLVMVPVDPFVEPVEKPFR